MPKYDANKFIAEIVPGALSQCKLFPGLFPSLAIAQACHESRYGDSGLAKECFNLFGIKAGDSWKGKKKAYPTKEYLNSKWVTVNDFFRKYDNFAQSIWDRNNLLSKPRYIRAGVLSAKNPEQQAYAIVKGGYATDPAYAERLIETIRTHNLKQYDV